MRLVLSLALTTVALGGCARAPVPPASPPPAPIAAVAPPPGPTSPEILFAGSNDFDLVNLVADARFAYWGYRGDKGIVRVPISGGPPVTLVSGTEMPVTSLAADAKYLYFTTGRHVESESVQPSLVPRTTHAEHFEGVVARVAKEGTSKVEEISSGRFKPEDVATDGTYAYWIMAKRDAALVRQPLGQVDAPEVLAHGRFWPGSLIVARGYAYWIDADAGSVVMQLSTRGGEARKLSSGSATRPVRLAADDSAVYFTDSGPAEGQGAIVRIPLGAGSPSRIAENLATPRGVAVAGGYVYWLNKGTSAKNFKDGSLEKAPVSGGAKVRMADGLTAPDRLAVSDARVVWTELDGTVKDMGR